VYKYTTLDENLSLLFTLEPFDLWTHSKSLIFQSVGSGPYSNPKKILKINSKSKDLGLCSALHFYL